MPAVSRAQQKALYAKKGSKWVHEHHFDEIVAKGKGKKAKPDPKPAAKKKRARR